MFATFSDGTRCCCGHPERPHDHPSREPLALPAPARIAGAARAFSEGNGYLSGQLVDRFA
jgi:hypothetical protein